LILLTTADKLSQNLPNSKYSNRTRKRARGAAAGMVNPMQAAGKKN
jgi:hypothetical protein